jgi:hypothetical protein
MGKQKRTFGPDSRSKIRNLARLRLNGFLKKENGLPYNRTFWTIDTWWRDFDHASRATYHKVVYCTLEIQRGNCSMWEAVKQSLQPTAGEGWYASNGPRDMLHCGTGEEGKERAERVSKLLNLGMANFLVRDQTYRDELMKNLRHLNDAALSIDPEIVPDIRPNSPLYPTLLAVKTVKTAAVAIQSLLLLGPSSSK